MRTRLLLLVSVAVLLAPAFSAGAADRATLPLLITLPDDAFTPAERDAVAAWTLSQPEIRDRIGADRTRLLRMGSETVKDDQGATYRRAALFIRNYDQGLVHAVYVNLDNATIEIQDRTSAVQPNAEESAEAVALVAADSRVSPLLTNPGVWVGGVFYLRSTLAADPCAREVCLLVELKHEQAWMGHAGRIVVNLSRQAVVNPNFQAPVDPAKPSPMTAPEGR